MVRTLAHVLWNQELWSSRHPLCRYRAWDKCSKRCFSSSPELQNNSRQTLSHRAPLFCGYHCARERTRTSNPLRELPPQGSASTNFATRACEHYNAPFSRFQTVGYAAVTSFFSSTAGSASAGAGSAKSSVEIFIVRILRS